MYLKHPFKSGMLKFFYAFIQHIQNLFLVLRNSI